MIRKIIHITLLTLSSLFIAGLITVSNSTLSNAADLSKFKVGNIMSDYVMSNKNSMTEAQIQSFLTNKNSCKDTNIAKAAQYPNMVYNIKNGRFVCLSEETFNGETAAKIIWQAAQDYGINPQVLIVLLQKEQGLVTDTWPNHNIQYRSATGYGCPDNAPCEQSYYGFKNQIRNAANFFRAHLDNRSGWYKPHTPGTQAVLYNPLSHCGSSSVYIENRATSGLYSYTPYQPNRAALNAGYGTGDGCSSYGNRNFWNWFNDWFGSTQANQVVSMETPRWMKISTPVQKYDLLNNITVGDTLQTDRQLRFVDKFEHNGSWYLRTEYDVNNNILQGIPLSHITEIEFNPIEPKWKIINYDGVHKYIPNTEKWVGVGINPLPISTVLKVNEKTTINSVTTYRTQYDSEYESYVGIRSERLDDLNQINPLDTPRVMRINKNTKEYTLDGNTCRSLSKNALVYIKGKFIYKDILAFSTEQSNINPNTLCYIDASSLNWNPVLFDPFETPRDMKLLKNVSRINLETGEIYDILEKNRIIHFSSKTYKDGRWYYRTTYNTNEESPLAIDSTYITDL